MAARTVRLAIVGTGGMAHSHAGQFREIPGVKLVAACDVIEEKARAFAEKFGIPRWTTDLDAIVGDDAIDAVTVVTPDNHHAPVSLAAIGAGKHVLCEKPLAENYADASRMARAARRKGVIHGVNLSYRGSGGLYKIRQLVESGRLGTIHHVEASYLQSWLSSNGWGDWRKTPGFLWRLSRKHGSMGALGDIGIHILDFATFPVGRLKAIQCTLKTFPKVKGNRLGEYTLDANDTALIQAEFDGGALGTVSMTRWATGHANSLHLQVHGDLGAARLDLDRDFNQIETCIGEARHKTVWKTVPCKSVPDNYQRFIRAIRSGKQGEPGFDRGAQVQKWLDACFTAHEKGAWIKV